MTPNAQLATSIPLYLPSSLPVSTPCDMRLLEMEYELRQGQLGDALEDLRSGLRLLSFLLFDKRKNSAGQHMQTRSITLIERANLRISFSAETYRIARTALLHLATRLDKPKEEIEKTFPPLKESDVQAMPIENLQSLRKRGREEEEVQPWDLPRISEGHRTISWIWMNMNGNRPDEDTEEYNEGGLSNF